MIGSSFTYDRTMDWHRLGRYTHTEYEYLIQLGTADELMRHVLFYFDKIALPTNNIFPPIPDLQYLEDEGELECFPIEVPGAESMAAVLTGVRLAGRTTIPHLGLHGQNINGPLERISQHHREIFDRHERTQRGAWNYAQIGRVREFSTEAPVRGYSMDLYDCLPVPSADASFEDILRFKRREKSALFDLRAELDAIYLRIANCDGDIDFAAAHEIAQLRKAILAVEDLLNTSRVAHYRKSVQVELLKPQKLVAAGLAASKAAELAAQSNLSPMVVIAAGTLAAAAFVINVKDIPSPLERAGAFRYIYNATRDQVLSRP